MGSGVGIVIGQFVSAELWAQAWNELETLAQQDTYRSLQNRRRAGKSEEDHIQTTRQLW